MKLVRLLTSLGLLSLPMSSYGYPSNATTSATSTAPATTHTFIVGSSNGTLRYDPTNITANPGDTVIWSFRAKNHTVSQSNFAKPCVPLQNSTGVPGFFTGFNPVGPFNSSDFPTYEIVVNNTDPIWFYCSQTNHCVNGMVGSINANPDGNMSFTDFQNLAMTSGISNPLIPPIQSGPETLFVSPMPPPGNATASSTSAMPTTTHTITVGNANGSLTYNPPNITAEAGDLVRFTFMPKNHSVTQSNFAQPCIPLGASENIPGFWSGFNPVGENQTTDFPYFDILINDTKPIWFYCSQTSHCMHGMVGSINANPTGNATFAQFEQLAMVSGVTNPVLPLFITGGFSSMYGWPGTFSSRLSGGSTTTAKATALAKAALIGIIVGAVALVLFSALVLYCCCCRARRNKGVSARQGGGGFMGYGAPSYRSVNAPAPAPAVDLDDEPLVPQGEKGNGAYYNESAYNPQQPPSIGGQYSTAWDQHK